MARSIVFFDVLPFDTGTLRSGCSPFTRRLQIRRGDLTSGRARCSTSRAANSAASPPSWERMPAPDCSGLRRYPWRHCPRENGEARGQAGSATMTTAGTVRIAIDAMGGDGAPAAIVEGVIEARKAYAAPMVVVGLPEAVQPLLRNHPGLEFVPASEVIEVDDPPLE